MTRLAASPYNTGMYIDSHCHIKFPELAARMPEILARMEENKVTHALCVSVDLPDFPSVLALAEQYPNIYASVGVHPDYEDTLEPSVAQLVLRTSSRSYFFHFSATARSIAPVCLSQMRIG